MRKILVALGLLTVIASVMFNAFVGTQVALIGIAFILVAKE